MDIGTLSKQILEKITEEQILEALKELGATPVKIKSKEIWFRTICHGGDSHKLCYFREGKDFYCYTNCGKMSLFQFIMNVKNCSFKDSVVYWSKIAQISTRQGIQSNKFGLATQETNAVLDRREYKKQKRQKSVEGQSNIVRLEPIEPLQTKVMDFFEDVYYMGWIEEGITIPTMEKYNIKWYEQAKHIIIPHENINGKLVGIRRRTLNDYEIEYSGKYMPEIINEKQENHSYAHALGLNLYGLYQNQEAIRKYKQVIIVEAEKSVLLADSYFGEESIVVATCGFNISNWQRDILTKHLGVKTVILSFDNDVDLRKFEGLESKNERPTDKEISEYNKYCERILKLGQKFVGEAQVFTIWDRQGLLDLKDSPLDKGKEIFQQLLRTKEKIEISNKYLKE